ncbi:MAG: hypothetical protein LBH73_09050 [Spirochaetaceae bacterium]|jgi:hypothetical protein|nr:hypothetical protein [Spirochaetaceae bacterium]
MAKGKKAKRKFSERWKEQPFHAIGAFALFMPVALVLIVLFRIIYPGQAAPLPVYAIPWRLSRGFLEFVELFPALAVSALIISFGIRKVPDEDYARFSIKFLDVIRGHILAAIIASVFYSILFLAAYPLVQNYTSSMVFNGYLFRSAKERAGVLAAEQSWVEAGRFLAVCQRIWKESPEIEALRIQVDIGLEDMRRAESPRSQERAPVSAYAPVNAADALTLARRALAEERYYDAHWFATLAKQLSGPESAEYGMSSQLASQAWNAIVSLEPNNRERQRYSLYHKKRDGYNALISEDWIRAYYIFKDLIESTPDDPDVGNFLSMSEAGVRGEAFFIDEMDTAIGEILNGAIFSLPRLPSGRLVARFASLSSFKDFSYALGVEILGFSGESSLVYRVEAPYGKIFPLTVDIPGGENSHTVLLLRALDRENENQRWDSRWERAAGGGAGQEEELGSAQLVLDIGYDDFLLSVEARRDMAYLSIRDLLNGAKRLGTRGHIPELFQAEALHRLGEPLMFLPFAITAIIAGWRLRALKRPRYMGIPMFAIIPLVFAVLAAALRAAVHTVGSLLALTLPFPAALGVFIAVALTSFIVSLIVLAGQHG